VGKAYHFVTLPQTLSKGLTLLFEKQDGSIAFRAVNKSVTIDAAHFKTLMEVDKGLTFEKDYFTFSPTKVSLPKNGGTFTIKVHSSVDFHFDIACDWIKEVFHEGNPIMEATYTFRASGNTGEAREGFIQVCNDSNCSLVTVSQEAGTEDDWMTGVFDHHSLGMRFTATWCGYCPNMSETFQKAKALLGDKFQYACFYSSSSGGLYGFSSIGTLTSQYSVSGFPTGIVDGRRLIQNYSSDYACNLIDQAVKETENNYPTATAIGLKSSLNGKKVTVDVDVFSHIADNYKLTVLLLENGIVGYQRDFYVGDHDDFVHDKVVRMAFNSVSGASFTTTGNADKKSFQYSLTISDEYNTDNLEILAYVQRPFGSQSVLQSGSYGDWYVDNCCSAPVGVTWAPDLK
jgi:thiol-disulfide isomerase/thioredoxin